MVEKKTASTTAAGPVLMVLPLDALEIDGQNPRSAPAADILQGLRTALEQEGGYAQPPSVYPIGDGKFRVLHGNTRVQAARGVVDEVPVLVTSAPESAGVGVISQVSVNMLQGALNPVDIGKALLRVQREEELSLGGLVDLLKTRGIVRSRTWVMQHIELARMAPAMQSMVVEGHITARHAWVLRGQSLEQQIQWARRVYEEGMPVKDLARALGIGPEAVDESPPLDRPSATSSEPMPSATAPIWSGSSLQADGDRAQGTDGSGAGRRSQKDGQVVTGWTLIPVNPVTTGGAPACPPAIIRKYPWVAQSTIEARALAREASQAGYSDRAAFSLVDRALQEAASNPDPAVKQLLNALKMADEKASTFADCPALTEFASLRLKNLRQSLTLDQLEPRAGVDVAAS